MALLPEPAAAIATQPAEAAASPIEEDLLVQLLSLKRVYVDRLGGGDTAAQMRDMIISSMQSAKLFVITENEERADAILRGSAEDLIYTNTEQSSEGIGARINAGRSSSKNSRGGYSGLSVSDNESHRRSERRHEASAAVRLVNRDGDVIWSTTQESTGGKFLGSSADVADKITRQLVDDYRRAKRVRR
ncbi:MAG: hypothetical protein WD696_11815 [Bryobacteraceae bacterium]